MANDIPTINCFQGTPYREPQTGEWRCPDKVEGAAVNVRGIDQMRDRTTDPKALPTVATKDTLFGLPRPLVYIGGGILALFLLSSTDGKK